MYELKKTGKILTSKSVGTRPSSYEKKKIPGGGLTKIEKHCSRRFWRRKKPLTSAGIESPTVQPVLK